MDNRAKSHIEPINDKYRPNIRAAEYIQKINSGGYEGRDRMQ